MDLSPSPYLEYSFIVEPSDPWVDVLVSQLGDIGFESFIETDNGVKGYIKKDEITELDLNNVDLIHSGMCSISFSMLEIPQENWNQKWESNFEPISVDNQCFIRAPFHQKSDLEFDIIIEPKMSFGTGHHETTYMMIKHLLALNLVGKTVLDMGCGTAVLAILSAMKGADSIDAIDIDEWCYINSLENIERNNCSNINVFKGDVGLIKDKRYDIILANINRNILLSDINHYANALNENGTLLLSGFYKNDIDVIEAECNRNSLKLSERIEKNNWVSLKFIN